MKDETNAVIKTLQKCEVATIMATGDNVLTAISIARQCGIVAKLDSVYLGDVAIDKQTSEPYIVWTIQGQTESENSAIQNEFVLTKQSGKEFQPDTLPWDYQDNNISVALTGKAFNHVLQRQNENPFILNAILTKGKVYARMAPDDKALLVQNLQDKLKINCGMCGDGANDCGALKTAAVGISLSEAEASIAAPFTSKV